MSDSRTNSDHGDPKQWPADLGVPDAEALDALAQAGFYPDRVVPELRDRAARAARLLGLLDTPDSVEAVRDEALIDATLARVMRARSLQRLDAEPNLALALSPDDEDALEMLVGAGFDPERVPSAVRARAGRQAELLALLDVMEPISGAESAVRATLSRIEDSVEREEDRLRIDPSRSGRLRFRMSDLVSVAALLLLAGSVLIPMGGAMREFSRRASCQASLMTAGLGLGQYASDNKDALPLASESRAGNVWWSVGDREHSNSANLFTITRTGYTRLEDLACSGNPSACKDVRETNAFDWRSIDEVSFSYQNMFASERPKWIGAKTVVVVSDRSPIVPLAIRGLKINPMSNSLQHAGMGQNMLCTDGVVLWSRTPVLASGDNVFLPRPLEDLIATLRQLNEAEPLKGTETPAGADDTFLTP